MEKIIVLLLAISMSNAFATESKKVCHDKVVNGKKTTICKQVKIHKKLENTTNVPVKKK